MLGAVQRRLFNITTLLSLVLCLGVVALWIRSISAWDGWSYAPGNAPLAYIVFSSDGAVTAGQGFIYNFNPDYHRGLLHGVYQPNTNFSLTDAQFMGIGWIRMSFRSLGVDHPDLAGRNLFLVEVPMWMLTILCSLLPAAWTVQRILSMRRCTKGICATCGYDLRATPERCPECGSVPAAR